jgi:hypothetical protein
MKTNTVFEVVNKKDKVFVRPKNPYSPKTEAKKYYEFEKENDKLIPIVNHDPNKKEYNYSCLKFYDNTYIYKKPLQIGNPHSDNYLEIEFNEDQFIVFHQGNKKDYIFTNDQALQLAKYILDILE